MLTQITPTLTGNTGQYELFQLPQPHYATNVCSSLATHRARLKMWQLKKINNNVKVNFYWRL